MSLMGFSIVVMKHHGQNQLGVIDLFQLILPHHSSSLREIRAGTWRQELMQKLWKSVAFWLLPHGFLCLLSYSPPKYLPIISHQSKKCTTGPSNEGIFSVEVLSSRMTLDCVKLT